MKEELNYQLIAVSIVAEMHGHWLAGWRQHPDGYWQTFCRRCRKNVLVKGEFVSSLPGPCPGKGTNEDIDWLEDEDDLDQDG